jgi:hypothetical protein
LIRHPNPGARCSGASSGATQRAHLEWWLAEPEGSAGYLQSTVFTKVVVFAADVALPLFLVLVVLLGVPVLAVVTGVMALRRVVTSPLGVSRQAAPRRVGWWRLVPLTVGMLLLVGAWVDAMTCCAAAPAAPCCSSAEPACP